MFFLIHLYVLVFSAIAQTSLSVYVAPIQVINATPSIQATISNYSIAGYTATHLDSARVKVDGSIKSINTVYEKIYVYDISTIGLAEPGCNYKREPKKCSMTNGHYLLMPFIEVNEHEVIVRLILYDPELQIVGGGVKTTQKIIKYIKQQEITTIEEQGMMGSKTTTHKPKEELPLKWEIPYKLLDYHIHQASLGLWLGRTL